MNNVFGTFPNYPKAWDFDVASDKFVFKSIIFDDPGIKFAMLPEIIQSYPFVSSVSYNGATTYFDLKVDANKLKQDPIYGDADMIDVARGIVATALQRIILSNSYLDQLAIEKQKRSGMNYTSAYKYMASYIEQPRLLCMFFRVFHYGNGEFAIDFV